MKYPIFKVHIDAEEAIVNLRKVLSSGYLNEGEEVQLFSKNLTDYLKVKNLVLVNSCTSALTMALKLAGVGVDTEVISTSMTCVATNTPINNLGARVVWADIDYRTGNISAESVMSKITDKTRAVMCVNWAGLPCDLRKLHEICKKNSIKLIQDAAHAFGAKYYGSDISNHADFTCFSFQAIKHITSGDGGALICANDDDYKKAKKMKWFGLDRDATKDEKGEWKGQRWEADVEEAGYKFNMNNVSAAIGNSQIKYFEEITQKHIKNAATYNEIFSTHDNILPLQYPNEAEPSFWVYTVLLNKNLDRDTILKKLNELGIGAGLVHVPNHYYTCFKDSFVDLKNVDYFHAHQISLPNGWWLNEEDIRYIAHCIENTT